MITFQVKKSQRLRLHNDWNYFITSTQNASIISVCTIFSVAGSFIFGENIKWSYGNVVLATARTSPCCLGNREKEHGTEDTRWFLFTSTVNFSSWKLVLTGKKCNEIKSWMAHLYASIRAVVKSMFFGWVRALNLPTYWAWHGLGLVAFTENLFKFRDNLPIDLLIGGLAPPDPPPLFTTKIWCSKQTSSQWMFVSINHLHFC